MAIVKEIILIDEIEYEKTYSDTGFFIERDGAVYEEAVDPLDSGRVYTETENIIEGYNVEATEEDYLNALMELGGKAV